jgi:hypothetical protein
MTEQIGFNVFYYDGSWHLLNATSDIYDEPTDVINGVTEVKVRVEFPQFSAMAVATKAWVGDDTAKLLAYTDVGVSEATMNADFDAVTKFFYGRISSVEHHVNHIIVKAKQLMAKWLGEPVQNATNVIATTTVASYDATHITLASDTGLEDARGLRVTLGTPVPAARTDVHSYSDWSDFVIGDSGDENGAEANIDDSDADFWQKDGLDLDADGPAVKSNPVIGFDITHPPPQFPIVVSFTGFISKEGTEITPNAIKAWNFKTSAYDTLASSVTANPATLSYSLSSDYVDLSASPMVKIKIFGGMYLTAAGDHFSNVSIQYIRITYTDINQHAAIEYQVASHAGAVAEIEGGNPYTDFINALDKVEILYTEKEFLEDDAAYGLAQSLYDGKVNSINFVPATIKPTYSLFRWMLINNYLTNINRRNGTFFYPSRKTTSGKYDIVFRATGVNNGLSITPNEFDGDDFSNAFNRDDMCRAVVVQNKNTWAARSSAGDHTAAVPGVLPANDLQILALNMPELPDNYLLDYATAVYNFRNALGDDIIIPVRDILISEVTGSEALIDEDYQTFAVDAKIRGSHGWDSWVEDANSFFKGKDSGAGDIIGWLVDNGGENINPTLVITAHTMANGEHVDFDQDVISTTTAGGFACCLTSAGTYICVVFVKPLGLIIRNNGSWDSSVSFADCQGHRLQISIERVSASTYKVGYAIDGGSMSYSGTMTCADGTSFASNIDGLRYRTQGSQTCEIYSRTIDASWTTAPTYEDVSHPVRDAHDDKLHVGASIHVHAAPTTKEGTDYQCDDDFLLRSIKWTKDRQAILFLGAAIATAQSPEQMLDEILARHDHASTS